MALPEPEPEPETPKDPLASILRNVEKLKDQPKPTQTQQAEVPQPASQRQPSRIEVDAVAREVERQLSACWRIEPGARGAEDHVVEIKVNLNPDGSVRQVKIVDVQRMVADAYYRSAAENARRAILSCSPFDLPLDQFEIWREMTLNFDPRRMFGG